MRRIRTRERGAMLMELALLLPLLVLIVMLVLEGSRLVRTHQVLNNAAREGARLSVQQENSGNTPDIAGEVVTYATQNGVPITTGNVTINQAATIPTPSGISMSASVVTVNYTYTMNYLSVFAWLGVPTSFPLQGSAEFRNFYNSN
jgi:Flp pilus assembly protein TadG